MSNVITASVCDTENTGLILTEYNSIREYFIMKKMHNQYDAFNDKKILFVLNNNLPIFKSVSTIPLYISSNTEFMDAFNSHDKQKTLPVFLNRDGVKHWVFFNAWWR